VSDVDAYRGDLDVWAEKDTSVGAWVVRDVVVREELVSE
jgi:hypothetical protein